jgi:hypothetical protein
MRILHLEARRALGVDELRSSGPGARSVSRPANDVQLRFAMIEERSVILDMY